MHRGIVVCIVAVVVLEGAAATMTAPVVQAQSSPSPAKTPPGEFVWHDLVTDNPAACRAFYGALFGWTFEAADGIDPGYTMIKHDGVPIGGIVTRERQKDDTGVAQWLAYVVVADVDRATEAFRKAGRVFRGPLNARRDLRVAVVADAQGAPLGLASRGPAVADEQRPPAVHRWLWMEYVARDPAAALQFYGDVVGFKHEIQEVRQDFTYYLLTTDRPRAGLFRSPWERETSAWLPYVRVADAAAAAARVTELGGTVVLPPRPGVRNGSLAIVLDPTGAPLALQKFPFDSGETP